MTNVSSRNSYFARADAIITAGVKSMLQGYEKLCLEEQLDCEDRYKTDPKIGELLKIIFAERDKLREEENKNDQGHAKQIFPREALAIMERVKQGMDYWTQYCLRGDGKKE